MKPSQNMLFLILVLSCAEPETPPSVPLIVQVTDEADLPVRGAHITVNRQAVGETNGQGVRRIRLEGPEGRIVSVQAKCPKGYRPQEKVPLQITCRFLRHMTDPGGGSMPLKAHFTCGIAEQSWVLLVKTNAIEGLFVTAMGETVATTDRDGVAQALLTGGPGDEVEVVIDTSNQPDLRPEDPSRRVRVPVKKQILIFEQSFKRDRPRKKKRRRFGGRRLGPRRI